MVTNEGIRRRTGVAKLEEILRRNRLRWFGHVNRLDDSRLVKQVLRWVPKGGKRRRGRPRKNWRSTVEDDLEILDMTWEETEEIAGDKTIWRSCVAQCAAGTRTD